METCGLTVVYSFKICCLSHLFSVLCLFFHVDRSFSALFRYVRVVLIVNCDLMMVQKHMWSLSGWDLWPPAALQGLTAARICQGGRKQSRRPKTGAGVGFTAASLWIEQRQREKTLVYLSRLYPAHTLVFIEEECVHVPRAADQPAHGLIWGSSGWKNEVGMKCKDERVTLE